MNIKTLPCGEYQTNCYIIEKDGKALIVDPGDDFSLISHTLENIDADPEAILLTHGHFDHIVSVDAIIQKYGIPVYIHPEDSHYFNLPEYNLSCFYYKEIIIEAKPVLLLDNELQIDEFDIRIFETPGHTQGGVCFLIGNDLFSGDTIFHETVGRTDMINGKHKLLMKSVKRLLESLSENVTIYPGHGQSTTVAHEIANNPFYKREV